MVNQQPGGFGEQQWYPQLPEGYTGYNQPNQNYQAQGFRPGQGGGGRYPGHGFPPGQGGFPGQGFPPGQGGYPGQGFPPGQGGYPGQGGFPGQGFPPGHGGYPGHHNPGRPPSDGQQGGQAQAPTSAPPNYVPEYPGGGGGIQTFAVDPGAIRGCMYRYTYVWTSRRQGFWFYPTYVGRTSVAGFRWRSRQRRWEYFGIDLNNIDQFRCS